MNLSNNPVRFGARILIQRDNQADAVQVLHNHLSEFVIDDMDPKTAIQLVEPRKQLEKGKHIIGLLTGPDYDAFQRDCEGLANQKPAYNPAALVQAQMDLEDAYFTPNAIQQFEPESTLKRIQQEILDQQA